MARHNKETSATDLLDNIYYTHEPLENWIKNHSDAFNSLSEPKAYSLGRLLEKHAVHRAEHPAIIFNDRVYTYDQFNRQANRYADFFLRQGFKSGDTVAMLMPNEPDFLFILCGLSKIGVIAALINIDLRGAVLAQGINIVEAKAVVLSSKLISLYQEAAGLIRLHSPRRVFVSAEEKPIDFNGRMEYLAPLLSGASEENPYTTKDISSEDILAIIYTSGNYGPRKAVPIQHKRTLLVGHQAAIYCHMHPQRIQYACLPLYLNVGLNICLGSMLVSGSTMVLKEKFSAANFWKEINNYKVDYFVGVGEIFRYLHGMPEDDADGRNTLEVAICNGINKELQEPFRNRFLLKHMIEIYGTAENVGFFINHEEHPGMCGNLSLGGVRQGEVVRCDPDNGAVFRNEEGKVIPCQAGEQGLLLCALNDYNTFPGYLGDPEASQLKLVNNALELGDSYLNTYDLVRLEENGDISFVDRLGNAYRWKGKTVAAHVVADVIMHFMGPIEDVCVFSVKINGLEGRCGMAAIKLFPGEKLNWNKFTDYLDRKMPTHARPVFIRLMNKLPEGKSLSDMLSSLKKDAYSPGIADGPLFFFDNEENMYKPLTVEDYEAIISKNFFQEN